MTVRVTQSMLNRTFLQNLSRNLASLDKLQNQLSSGRKIAKPSDDPVVAVRGMAYRSALVEIAQFKRNVDEGLTWLETTDKALDEATNLLQRARELLVRGLNGAMTDEDRAAMAKEIAQIKEQLGNVANTAVAGRYIFAGTDTKNPPYDAQTGTWANQNGQDILVEIGKGIYLPINVLGKDVFAVPDAANGVFGVLDTIARGLDGDATVNLNAELGRLDQQLDNLLAVRATVGARMNRFELIQYRLESDEVNVTRLLSKEEDADMAEVITNLKTAENVYRAALAAGARIIQPSLVDFLR